MMGGLTASWPSHLVTVLVYSYSVQGLRGWYRGVRGGETGRRRGRREPAARMEK